jgi:hypothetical protein
MLLDRIVRVKIAVMLKVKKFSKSFLSHIGRVRLKLLKKNVMEVHLFQILKVYIHIQCSIVF